MLSATILNEINVHLRGRDNLLKRVLIHVGGLNLSLVMRQLLGKGTPRGLQDLSAESLLMLLQLWIAVLVGTEQAGASGTMLMPLTCRVHRIFHTLRRRMRKSLLTRAARATGPGKGMRKHGLGGPGFC